MSPRDNLFSRGGNRQTNPLREKLSKNYSEWKKISLFEREIVLRQYIRTLGPAHLKVLVATADVMELRLVADRIKRKPVYLCRDLERFRAFARRKLKDIRGIIYRNSSFLISGAETRLNKKLIDGLTELLEKTAFLAHPVFFRDNENGLLAGAILRNAESAYKSANIEWLSSIADDASLLLPPGDTKLDDDTSRRVAEESAVLASRIKSRRELFPLNVADRLDDPDWVAERKHIMEKEYEALDEEKIRLETFIKQNPPADLAD